MIFHVDLDAFFAAIEQRDNPKLRRKPVIVGGVNPQGQRVNRGVVATASYEARHYGIYSGMPIFEAKKLCPHAVFVAGSFEKYRDASRKMYKIFDHYTDRIEPLGLDEVYLDFYGFENYYKDFVEVAKSIKTNIKKEIGITASCGIAKNKLVAKIASSVNKPDGLTYIKKGKEKEFLSPLPIENLYGVGRRMEKHLKNLGIKTIGDLASYPPELLLARFGKYGEYLWLWANGEDFRDVTLEYPIKSVGRSTTFPKNSVDPTYVKSVLRYLSEKVAHELREENLETGCISVTLRYFDFKTLSHQKMIADPVKTAREVHKIACELFDKVWSGLPLRVVGIRVSGFYQEKIQSSFFSLELQKQEKIEECIDRLREKYGFWSIYPASLAFLAKIYPRSKKGFLLHTPSCSRI